MKSIKITAVPPGEPPLWVRKAWVGVVLPVTENPARGTQVGVLGGKPQNVGGYEVNAQAAIEILRNKSRKAALWWDENFRAAVYANLVFSKRVCEVVSDTPVVGV